MPPRSSLFSAASPLSHLRSLCSSLSWHLRIDLPTMASVAGTAFSVSARPSRRSLQVAIAFYVVFPSENGMVFNGLSVVKSVSFANQRKSIPSLRSHPASSRFRVSCAAKPETLEKVCKIVKKQLALPESATVAGHSKFADLGADSLDTVEVVMGLEEAFGITVEEDSAQSIVTVQDAADLIEDLVCAKSS
ncbi:hypothetical protein MUK42_04372 [Musa troglodytarum]|uniref:Acyl carrier protein n=2 Tax=Musa troglodytarum TaxID=320322 RepID=A0A9E7HGX9_9LILI|nr:hypothetical protein MUK42_04372 [Musa troglodytarum]